MQDDDTSAQAEALEFDALFSTRRPKDMRAGLASGAKSVLKGVAAGAVSGTWFRAVEGVLV